MEKAKTIELMARRKYADELVLKGARKKESQNKARERQALGNLNTTWMNAITGNSGNNGGMVGMNYPQNSEGGRANGGGGSPLITSELHMHHFLIVRHPSLKPAPLLRRSCQLRRMIVQ